MCTLQTTWTTLFFSFISDVTIVHPLHLVSPSFTSILPQSLYYVMLVFDLKDVSSFGCYVAESRIKIKYYQTVVVNAFFLITK